MPWLFGVCKTFLHLDANHLIGHISAMANHDSKRGDASPQIQGNPRDAAKQDRLAARLRDNLRRRKDQSRGRAEPADAPASSQPGTEEGEPEG